MCNSLSVDLILVPQGQEYQAVCRGLKGLNSKIKVIPIPIGKDAVNSFFQNNKLIENSQELRILLLGLAGSLSQQYSIGDIIIYQELADLTSQINQKLDHTIIVEIQNKLENKVKLVKGITSDRLIFSAKEKQKLAEETGSEVVDMEATAVAKYFKSVTILRVISDDCQADLPDITKAIASDGSLKPLPLAISFLRQPFLAWRLIRGSLLSLKILEKVTRELIMDN